ncbi:MAG: hypothetical protein IKH04_08445 [Kiritimatiellae bacterium]|nr:hypothetical protein [Kiritimatiellia bacterium]
MKKGKRTILAAAATIVVAAALFLLCLGPIVKGAVKAFGPAFLGVPVNVESVSISAFSGKAEIRGFEIGNPKGFDTPYLLHADTLAVDLSVRELLGGSCHIRDLRVIGPRVWYHRKLTSSNVSTLLEGLDSKAAEEKEKEEKDRPDREKDSKPVVIDHFLFDEGVVGVKVGAGVEIPLAKVELNDIGKDGALMPAQLVRVVLGAVFDSVLHAVSAIGDLATDAVGTIGGAAKDAVGATVNAAGSVLRGVGTIFGGDDSQK